MIMILMGLGLFTLAALTPSLIGTLVRARRERRITRRLKFWLEREEPLYRHDQPGYPEDWDLRRIYVHRRDDNTCSQCGRYQRVRTSLFNPFDAKLYGPFHVHHIKHISQGGDHSLDNLELLCIDCHEDEHPFMRESVSRGMRPAA